MSILRYLIFTLLAVMATAVTWVVAVELREWRLIRSLGAHPGRDAFRRHVEAWQIIGAGGALPKPTVDEMVTGFGVTPEEARDYVDSWDEQAERADAIERADLADYASRLIEWIDG